MNEIISPGAQDILIVVDVQNDFCPGGALAVPDGDAIVGPINNLARHFAHVVLTQDWHPAGHESFASAHPGRKAYDSVTMAYGQQILWPDHCVQETRGAAFHWDLDIPHAAAIIRKGMNRRVDSYSTFYENDRTTPTGLVGYLRERRLSRIFLAGLALDFCVRYSAEDAHAQGFSVAIVEDCCRAIDVSGSLADAHQSFKDIGARILTSDSIA